MIVVSGPHGSGNMGRASKPHHLDRSETRLESILREGTYSVSEEEYCIALCEKYMKGAFAQIYYQGEITVVASREHIERCGPLKLECSYKLITFNLDLPLDLVGFMAAISNALSSEGVSLLAFSSFKTDHILVKENQLEMAERALARLGLRNVNQP